MREPAESGLMHPCKKATGGRRAWTTHELAYLAAHYGTRPVAEVAAHLGRSYKSVVSYAQCAGLARPRGSVPPPATLEAVLALCASVAEDPDDDACGCWRWLGRMVDGAPAVWSPARGLALKLRREVWRMAHGWEPPADMVVVATCGCSACVAPEHLQLRTRAKQLRLNARQQPAVARRAQRAAVARQRAKLDSESVALIRRSPEKAQVLADRFGVSRQTIYNARRHETWRDYGGTAALGGRR